MACLQLPTYTNKYTNTALMWQATVTLGILISISHSSTHLRWQGESYDVEPCVTLRPFECIGFLWPITYTLEFVAHQILVTKWNHLVFGMEKEQGVMTVTYTGFDVRNFPFKFILVLFPLSPFVLGNPQYSWKLQPKLVRFKSSSPFTTVRIRPLSFF